MNAHSWNFGNRQRVTHSPTYFPIDPGGTPSCAPCCVHRIDLSWWLSGAALPCRMLGIAGGAERESFATGGGCGLKPGWACGGTGGMIGAGPAGVLGL
jgi:hypothetical protein